MKKVFLAVALALGVGATASAQDTFVKGTNVVSFGVGTGSIASGSSISLPALSAIYETSVADNIFSTGKGSIGIGGQAEYSSYKTSVLNGYSMFVGLRGALHYEFVDKLDTYAGLTAGYYTHGLAGFRTNTFAVSFLAGARYYFTETLGGFAEFGSGLAYAKVGVSLKF